MAWKLAVSMYGEAPSFQLSNSADTDSRVWDLVRGQNPPHQFVPARFGIMTDPYRQCVAKPLALGSLRTGTPSFQICRIMWITTSND